MQENPSTPGTESTTASSTELATFGGGCFWCTEAVFQRVNGVLSVASGYSGGTAETANYKAVCSGTTQHAEVIQVKYDPAIITYPELLEIFWATHDPTTLNRQGNDIGPQYRSVVFYHNEAQKTAAEEYKENEARKIWDDPIVTEISPLETFYPAEDYHQEYFNSVGNRNPYCSIIIAPKVRKFQEQFAHKMKA